MSCVRYLRDLLAPLGVYDLEAPFNGGELQAQGEALDLAGAALEEIQRESLPLTAEGWGLEELSSLFPRRPAADSPRELGAALAALLRIGGDSFTPGAIRDTLAGCGALCDVEEGSRPGYVTISFPGIPGVPARFEEMRTIIEDILPAHVAAEYRFWYLTWAQLETKLTSWRALEDKQLTWRQLEIFV